jgi:hypothetical protein
MGAVATLLASVALFSHQPGKLVVSAPGYRLVLAAADARVLRLDDARGRTLLRGCLWECGRRVRHTWNRAARTLTLTYGTAATVTLRAGTTSFDLRLRLAPARKLRPNVRFPAFTGDTRAVTAGYSPNVLPGVRLARPFFSRVGNATQIYPSRWAFADWLAADVGAGHVAVYTVNRGALAPVTLGFLHLGPGRPCSGRVFCAFHQFETWVKPGSTWTSPVVRVRVGGDARQSILAYRRDNGIGAYRSLSAKLGPLLDVLARSPLLKADVPKLRLPFASWDLSTLPSPVLLHPVAYQPRGHDENDPDFLPPDPRWGTTADLANVMVRAHARGDLVMPYDNWGWWDTESATMRQRDPQDVGVLDAHGGVETVQYGDHDGVIVSPWAGAVEERAAASLRAWRSIPTDCVFVDQVGARPWLRDFNPASPTPLAYADGWLDILRVNADPCLMVEDGWDRLARDTVGFHGGIPMMQRELGALDAYFGAGNWQPYPLATWLLHDKVLMYQHDLYPLSLAVDGRMLAWNLAFGIVNSLEWRLGNERDPLLQFVARLQRDLGPYYVGVPLARFTTIAPGTTRSVFGMLTVDANVDTGTFTATAPGVTASGGADGRLVLTDGDGTLVVQLEGS